MEKILFPLKYMNVTQKMNGSYSHKGTFAIDFGHGGDEKVYAPFTGTIKKIYNTGSGSANGVWLLSNDKVEFADGTIDYAVVKVIHDNDISDLWVGKVVKQGEHFYNMGTAGNATGKHVHIEVAKGNKVGWYENSYGNWMITNSIDQTKAFFIPSDVVIKDNGGYNWTMLVDYVGTPVARDIYKEQLEVKVDKLRARKSPNGEKLGYINLGIYNILESKEQDGYVWYKVENDKWIAYQEDWITLYKAQEKPVVDDEPDEQEKEIVALKEQVVKLEQENLKLKQEIETLNAYIESDKEVKFIFIAPQDGRFAIDLKKDEELRVY